MGDHVLGVILHRLGIETGAIAREGEVRPGTPEPIAGLLGIVGVWQGARLGTCILHGLLEYGPPQGGLA